MKSGTSLGRDQACEKPGDDSWLRMLARSIRSVVLNFPSEEYTEIVDSVPAAQHSHRKSSCIWDGPRSEGLRKADRNGADDDPQQKQTAGETANRRTLHEAPLDWGRKPGERTGGRQTTAHRQFKGLGNCRPVISITDACAAIFSVIAVRLNSDAQHIARPFRRRR